MNFNFVPLFVVWGVLAVIVLGLFIWRKNVASNEDDSLHVMSGGNSTQQTVLAQKLDMIDKWGKILTVITVVLGLAIAAAYVYSQFVGRASIGA
jgi:hypothetical protein